ncbi:Serum paraoxonase/arylesterase 1 [Entomophthora muscae]|uniref:Serum paraoxonase/arylesterase 1 n=1 Tax=Entomophthora muscae TaxID=34485 RepID=A0ACC2RGC1_9FUNG|nr:Serum paraoxonase/arylesterase 1 [Entomophthora muscae]
MLAGGKVMFRDESGAYSEVARGLKYANGISLSSDRKLVYVAETMAAMLRVYERDEFDDLVLKEKVPLRFSPDNINVDPAFGHIYAAGFPLQSEAKANLAKYDGIKHTDVSASISARISNETGEDRFFGRNYKVEPVLMDDGNQLFSTTSCASDEERGVLLLSGLFTSKGMMDCRMKL